MKSILDPTFRYTPSVQTDVRKTFARIRRELRAQQVKEGTEEESRAIVLSLPRRQAMIEDRQESPVLAAQDMQPQIAAVERGVGMPQARRVAVAFDSVRIGRSTQEVAFDIAGERRIGVHPALGQQAEPGLTGAEAKFR